MRQCAVKYVRDSKEQEHIPRIHYYICGNWSSFKECHKILGQWTGTSHGKLKFFQRVSYNRLVFTKTVITLPYGVCTSPTSNQNARTSVQTKETQVILPAYAMSLKGEPIYTSFGVKFDRLWWVYTLARLVRTNISLCTCSMMGAVPFAHKFKKI